MFNLFDVGERAGSGIPNIFRVWHDQGWAEPTFTQSISPDRTTLSLAFKKTSDKKQAIKTVNKRIAEHQKIAIIEYLTDNVSAKASEIAGLLGVSPPRARAILSSMTTEGIIIAEGGNRNRTYRLKA